MRTHKFEVNPKYYDRLLNHPTTPLNISSSINNPHHRGVNGRIILQVGDKVIVHEVKNASEYDYNLKEYEHKEYYTGRSFTSKIVDIIHLSHNTLVFIGSIDSAEEGKCSAKEVFIKAELS